MNVIDWTLFFYSEFFPWFPALHIEFHNCSIWETYKGKVPAWCYLTWCDFIHIFWAKLQLNFYNPLIHNIPEIWEVWFQMQGHQWCPIPSPILRERKIQNTFQVLYLFARKPLTHWFIYQWKIKKLCIFSISRDYQVLGIFGFKS